jgi:hypothetical protein
MGIQNKYQLGQIAASARASAKSAQDNYQLELQRANAMYKEGTPENELYKNKLKAERDANMTEIYGTAAAKSAAERILGNEYLPENYGGVIPEPIDVSRNWGALGNWFTDYNDNKLKYDKQQAAINAKAEAAKGNY